MAEIVQRSPASNGERELCTFASAFRADVAALGYGVTWLLLPKGLKAFLPH